MSSILRRQAIRWKAQEAKGELPEGLYEALADGTSSSWEKRIIVNLAKISRIVDDDGIRPYSEFSEDWKYHGSVFGHTDNCELCNARIKENCRLVNEENGDEILIGNVCVNRYIEIRHSDGRALTPTEKKEYLKNEMKQAKTDFYRADFATRFPSALTDLARWEAWMTRKWSNTAGLYRTVIKRMATHGFLGPKTMKAWEDFYQTAEVDYQAWLIREDQKKLERAARLEREASRTVAFQAELSRRRNQFNTEADEWLSVATPIYENASPWEQTMVSRIATKMRASGLDGLTGGFRRFREETFTRKAMLDGDDIDVPPKAEILGRINNAGLLNTWEQSFLLSVIPKMVAKKSLSDKQLKIIDKIINTHGAKV